MSFANALGIKPYTLRLSVREALNNKRFSLLFCLNLALGMAGFIVLDAVKTSIQSNIEGRSQAIMGADISVSAYRPITDEEQNAAKSLIGPITAMSQEISFISMAASTANSKLVEVRAIDSAFPMYGEIRLQKAGLIRSGDAISFAQSEEAWVAPELLIQLSIKIGDSLKIGSSSYKVTDVVEEDPSSSTVSFAVAPRIYVAAQKIQQTGLIDKGSRISRTFKYKIPPTTDLAAVEAALKSRFKVTSEVKVASHKSASEQMARLLQYLNDYLGLVALVSLFLSSIGGTYLFRSQLAKKTKEIAVLLSLGASHKEARLIYVIQLTLMGLASAVATLVVCYAILPAIPSLIAPFLADKIEMSLSLRTIAIAILMGVGGSILFCLPHLIKLGEMRASLLFQEASTESADSTKIKITYYLPALLTYWILAVLQSKSLKVGSLFVVGFIIATVILTLVGMLFARLISLAILKPRSTSFISPSWPVRLAALNLVRDHSSTLSSFVAVGLGALFISLVPQLRTSLNQELTEPDAKKVPELFLFDIQDEQISPLSEMLKKQGLTLSHQSPLVRARLESINGVEPNEKFNNAPGTREREQEERSRNRMFNLSSRDKLSDSENMTEGRDFSGPYDWTDDKPVEASLEERFAERLGVGVGGKLKFDVQGVSVDMIVVSIRRVRWASFQPNFFVQVQPGVFNDTPKSWIASIGAEEGLDKTRLQMEIVKDFPNLSIVDVKSSVERILDVVTKISTAVNVMAWLTLIVGSAVLFSIANHQAQRRKKEIALIKIFGAPFNSVRKMILTEFILIGTATGVVGSALGSLFSLGISHFVFQAPWKPDLLIPIASCSALVLLVVTTGWLATGASLRTKSSELLNG